MNRLIYIVTIIIAIGLKILYEYELYEWMFFLRPVVYIIQNYTGNEFEYVEAIGFINNNLGISITSKCAGVNFFILCFLMLIFSFINRISNKLNKIILFIVSFIISYVTTIIANTSRIISNIYIIKTGIIKQDRLGGFLHLTLGITVYLTCLIIVYMIFSKYVIKLEEKYE